MSFSFSESVGEKGKKRDKARRRIVGIESDWGNSAWAQMLEFVGGEPGMPKYRTLRKTSKSGQRTAQVT